MLACSCVGSSRATELLFSSGRMASSWDIIACGDSKLWQAWTPSPHVWSNVVSPTSPQFLNQEPPRAQQLSLPDFLTVPHLGQLGADALVVTGASADRKRHIRHWYRSVIPTRLNTSQDLRHYANLLVQACMPSPHVCSDVESPSSPHFLNQEPPRAQQLRLPDFLAVPHWGHRALLGIGALVAPGASADIR